jgi:hypothetical protein
MKEERVKILDRVGTLEFSCLVKKNEVSSNCKERFCSAN